MLKRGYSSLLVLVLSMMLVVGLTGCGSDDASTEPENNEPVVNAEEPEVIVEECDEEQVLYEKAVAHFTNLPESNHMMKADKFKEQFELSSQSVAVLDIRSAEDFNKGHLEGAINIPMKEIGQRINEIPTDKEVAVICYSGQQASQTATALRFAGYNTKIIVGGFKAIQAAEFELVN